MVFGPSKSNVSEASSAGESKTYDSPRKQREVPRKVTSMQHSSAKPPRYGIAKRNPSPSVSRRHSPSPRSSPPTVSPQRTSSKNRQLPPKPGKISALQPTTRTTKGSDETTKTESKNPEKMTFHVRVSLGYLTGLKMDLLTKRKKRSYNNSLVVGYACLAKSGKNMALSQPLVPSIGSDAKNTSQKLIWASARSGKSTGGKTKRRLHFSLQLQKENESPVIGDDESCDTQTSYSSEVVKIIIGLKCGEEKLPLGVANIVINGKDTAQQKVDLAVRPISEAPDIDSGHKMHKSRLGIFGSAKKNQGKSFTNDACSYRLASNAILRVRLDIKSSVAGLDKAAIWGDINDDESFATSSSYITNISKAKAARMVSKVTHQNSASTRQRPIEDNREAPPPALYSSDDANKSFLSDWVGTSLDDRDTTQLRIEKTGPVIISSNPVYQPAPPIKYVTVHAVGDARSLVSSLTMTNQDLQSPLSCFPLCCGEDHDYIEDEVTVDPSFSIDSNLLPEKSSSIDDDDDDELSDEAAETASSKSDERGTVEADDLAQSISGEFTVGSTTSEKKSSINNMPTSSVLASKSLNEAARAHEEQANDDDETKDITVDTYTDLKDAQITLLRYANKVGLNMEDLLDGIEKRKMRKLGNWPISRAPHSKSSQSKASQSFKASQSKASQSKASQSKASQSKASQSNASQSKASQSRASQSRAEQSRADNSKASHSNTFQGLASESKESKAKIPDVLELQKVDSHATDPKSVEPSVASGSNRSVVAGSNASVPKFARSNSSGTKGSKSNSSQAKELQSNVSAVKALQPETTENSD